MKNTGGGNIDSDISHCIAAFSFWHIVRTVYKLNARHAQYVYSNYGIQYEEYRILLFLKYTKHNDKIADLANYLNLNANTASIIIERMVKQKLVRRVKSKHDRRVVIVQLTGKGENIIDQCFLPMMQLTIKDTSIFSDSKIQSIIMEFNKLINHICKQLSKDELKYVVTPYDLEKIADYLTLHH